MIVVPAKRGNKVTRAKTPAKRARKVALKPPPPPLPPEGTREQWYPLVNDPHLHAAGVEIGARAIIKTSGPPQLRIVFRAGDREWSVECVHVAVYSGTLESLPPDADLARSSEKHPIDLAPEEHFFALNSYVAGMAATGIGGMFAVAREAGDLPVGFNAMMQRQVMDAIVQVAPVVGIDFFLWVIEDAKQAMRKSGDTKFLVDLADIFKREQLCVAVHELTPPAILALLAGEAEETIRVGVAWNKNTPAEVLARLATDRYAPVRNAVTHNLNTGIEDLERLAGDEDVEVRRGVANNDHTLPEVLARLAGDEIMEVRETAAWKRHMPPKVLVHLASDENAGVRLAVACNQSTPPEGMARLVEDNDVQVRQVVAGKKTTPPDCLARLAGDTDVEVRLGVASNPHTPPEILTRLAGDENSSVRKAAQSSRNVT